MEGDELSRPRSYQVRVLRLWSDGAGVWRCSLEDPATGLRRGFSSPIELAAYVVNVFVDEPGGGELAGSDRQTRGEEV